VVPDTLNIDPDAVEAAIGPRTRAIVVVHYGGVACDMDRIMEIAARYGLVVIEDTAHGLGSTWRGRPLGGIGHLGTFSFHETKNVHCGEGGALVVNAPELVERAEIIQEKGTNRTRFFRGEVDKYTWLDLGSSYLLSEVCAAFLWAQLEYADEITAERLDIWSRYHQAFADLEAEGFVRRPIVPDHCQHSGHLYYLLLPSQAQRDEFIEALAREGVHSVFHYLPLHESPAGRRLGRTGGTTEVACDVSARLVRLPLYSDLGEEALQTVITASRRALVGQSIPTAS
jgi:dTDP-4-amino-4,6-dideoxygalactose transaminase